MTGLFRRINIEVYRKSAMKTLGHVMSVSHDQFTSCENGAVCLDGVGDRIFFWQEIKEKKLTTILGSNKTKENVIFIKSCGTQFTRIQIVRFWLFNGNTNKL